MTAIAIIPVSVHAGLIDNGSFVSDSNSGLDWLKLTETQAQSFTQVSNQLGSGGALEGWAFATSAQFDDLITNAGGTSMSCTNGTAYCGWSAANNGLVTYLLSFFGDLSGNNNSSGFLAHASGSSQWLARLMDSPGFSNTATKDFISTLDNPIPNTLMNSSVGSFLVRASSGTVPEPTTILLLGTGLALLGRTRNRKITK